MMRYSHALALIVALTFVVSSEGFRVKRKVGDSNHAAEVHFQQWQTEEDAEETSLEQPPLPDFIKLQEQEDKEEYTEDELPLPESAPGPFENSVQYKNNRCTTSEWKSFLKRFGGLKDRPDSDSNYWSKVSFSNGKKPCSKRNIVFFYTWGTVADHNGAFAYIGKDGCYDLDQWHMDACAVHVYRVKGVNEIKSKLNTYPDGSIKHVGLGGHGSPTRIRFGTGSDGSLTNSDSASKSMLSTLSKKMHRHASILLDSCSTAGKAKNGKKNLARTVADSVGKGVRVYAHPVTLHTIKSARFHAYYPILDGGAPVMYQSGARCPSWAKSSKVTSAGNCQCPSGKKCEYGSSGKSCPQAKGKSGRTYFLPKCAESWSKSKCKCA